MPSSYIPGPDVSIDSSALRFVRRDGEEVAWNAKKIEKAVGEAFVAQGQNPFSAAREIAQAITRRVAGFDVKIIALEQVQDLVQEELMRRGHFKIAEAYILYRSEHAKQRQVTQIDQQQGNILLLKGADGQHRLWTGADLLPRITWASQGLRLPLSSSEIAQRLCLKLHGEMDQKTLEEYFHRQARDLIAIDPEFDIFSAQFRWSFLYSQLLGWDPAQDSDPLFLEKQYRDAFPRYIQRAVEREILHPKMLEWNLDSLAAALDIKADRQWDCIATHTLFEDFLLRDWETGDVLELPQFLWMRVAMGLFLAETSPQREQWVLELYGLLKNRLFCVAPAALSYVGTSKAQLLSTYAYRVQDDLESIMIRGIADNALAVKWSATLSGSWTAVRGSGSPIRGTRRKSAGVMPFLELHQHQLTIAQPIREASEISSNVSLEIWHADIETFIDFQHSKGHEKASSALGTEVWIPDLFMKRVRTDGDWTLFRVEETRALLSLYGEDFEKAYEAWEQKAREGQCWSRTLSAAGLWGKIMTRIYETGFPHIAFKDRCNERHMLAPEGMVHSSGVDSEHMLYTEPEASMGCPVGAIILHRHLDEQGNLDQKRLQQTIHLAVRALDAMLDANDFPSEKTREWTGQYRPLGLGIIGLQDALYQKSLAFDDPQAVVFQDHCCEVFAYHTIAASLELAKEKGPYPRWEHSRWAQGKFSWESYHRPSCWPKTESAEAPTSLSWETLREQLQTNGLRNASLMAFSSMASVAHLMACYPGVMPATEYGFQKHFSHSRKVTVLHRTLVECLRAAGCWTKELYEALCHHPDQKISLPQLPESLQSVFRLAFDLDAESLLQAASVRQKWIDQSQSVDLYLTHPNMATLSSLYQRAWEYGLKTVHALKIAPLSTYHAEMPSFISLDDAMAGLRNGISHYDF
ncbi:MAG: ribonucleoside-diphosphate reductase subunit alpha [Puniceicoccales bacterium]|jgi:ribonucleoside-diphosphate reductase alpha chain|nr:ribonucleoside-diphosphate reductase subunit alpha [Puniceicoccales bacterium]